MKHALVLLAVLVLAPVVRADDTADIKQAYLTYLQALMDRDYEAAKAASTGDEMAMRMAELGRQRMAVMDKFKAAEKKFANTPPTTEPAKQTAAEVWSHMLRESTVVVDGDTATLTPKTVDMGERTIKPRPWGFKKINGAWKADLNNWQNPVTAASITQMEMMLEMAKPVIEKLDSGEIKSAEDLRAAMMAAEQKMREKRGGSGPTTQPK